jgi:hypothetical protein
VGSQVSFPGAGTAMAFAAAVAAGAAGYSYSQPMVSVMLGGIALIFGIFTLLIEHWSGPRSRVEVENKIRKLDLVEKLHELSKSEVITKGEFEKKRNEILLEL